MAATLVFAAGVAFREVCVGCARGRQRCNAERRRRLENALAADGARMSFLYACLLLASLAPRADSEQIRRAYPDRFDLNQLRRIRLGVNDAALFAGK
jgi:hypothetical protein